MDMSVSGFREMVEDMEACHAIVHGVAELDTTEHTCTETYNNILIVYTSSEACMFVCICVP